MKESKSIRNKRREFFENEILPLLHEKVGVDERAKECQYIFDTGADKIGRITFLPKGNFFQIHKTREWYRGDSIMWVIDNILSTHDYLRDNYLNAIK